MARTRLVKFMDGPLEGYVHTLKPGLPIPSSISRRDPKERNRLYVYRVLGCDGECHAFFDFTEQRELSLEDHQR